MYLSRGITRFSPFSKEKSALTGCPPLDQGSHCTALEQVTRKVLDAYTVRTRVRLHAYGHTFIARYAHDSTVTVRGSSVQLAVAMAFAPPASKHALPLTYVILWASPTPHGTPRHHRASSRSDVANQVGLMGHQTVM